MNLPAKPPRLSARAIADAAAAADLEKVQTLLSYGPKPGHLANKTINAITETINGEMGGSVAGEHRRLELLKLLVAAGCPIEGHTVFRPILNKEREILRFLIANGADVNVTAPHELFFAAMKGESPLNCAIKLGETDAVRELLRGGANPNMSAGSTIRFGYGVRHYPLWMAVNYDAVETARLLIEAGADLEAIDPENSTTALQHAVSHGHPEMVELLLHAGAEAATFDLNAESLVEAARKNRQLIRERLEKLISPDS